MRVLHLEDDPGDSLFVERGVTQQGLQASFIHARSREEFVTALETKNFDVVVVDNGLPGFNARHAIVLSKDRYPSIPVIVCSGAGRDGDVADAFAAGAADFVLKDYPWQLAVALRRAVTEPVVRPEPTKAATWLLVDVVQQLSLARSMDRIVDIVRRAARQLTGADGATFVLRDGACCYYVDEDAISPLWKGQRFPLQTCISGWAMLNRQSTIIPDIYKDPRVPQDAYRPTFVRSLAMVPIRSSAPIGAIGNYWATQHECTAEELALLEALANTTAVAMENVGMYESLESQVRERTRDLEVANRELEAFSAAVSHDLRAPLRTMNVELELTLADQVGNLPSASIAKLRDCTRRMSELIDDLLRLSRISRVPLNLESVDLSTLANKIIARLRAAEPSRAAEVKIDQTPAVLADPGLMEVVLDNLFSNAWKYSSKRDVVRIEFGSSENGQERVFSVKDNGAGFDANHAQRLFVPFSRLHDARDFPGVGIGLATVQRVIERHDGRVWAHSDGKNGAEFFFTIGKTAG